ncbi:hypothetical protein [Chondromyces crocatus]|uniref:Uncharacterized protein n=1 Tax=Chondromyces crocatus TaxID=52 RepID=A0A0K1E8I6_CHOCO|nr:hypothetical protein [Chondromyces crocatus]AKT37164.1 uncharacterized protein CMC5_012940 [Chondromyces crocatus]
MSDPLSALRVAVRELLLAEGARRLSALVDGAVVEMVGAPERWAVGAQEVRAMRLVLLVDPTAYAALSSDPAQLSTVRDAFARAVRTPETDLAGLALALRLPGIERGWHRAYRDAVPRALPERPEPEAVLGGAAALLDAQEQPTAAAMLRRARLEGAEVPGGGAQALVRYVLRLDPADCARVDKEPTLEERLRRAVRDAGTRAAATVAGVEIATALRPLEASDDAEARLTRALTALGAVVVPVYRDDTRVVLSFVTGGQLHQVEIAVEGAGTLDASASLRWQAEAVPAATVARAQVEDAAGASLVAALLCGSR